MQKKGAPDQIAGACEQIGGASTPIASKQIRIPFVDASLTLRALASATPAQFHNLSSVLSGLPVSHAP